MVDKVWKHFKKIIKSRLGLLLTAINWALFVFCYFTREDVGQPIHLYYERIFFQIIIILNIPAIAVAGLLSLSLGYSDAVGEKYWITKPIVALGFIFAITIQWLVIGYSIEKLWRRRKEIKNSRFS